MQKTVDLRELMHGQNYINLSIFSEELRASTYSSTRPNTKDGNDKSDSCIHVVHKYMSINIMDFSEILQSLFKYCKSIL